MQQYGSARSTIGLRVSTKERLDKCRAPGQCYDGILSQMVDMWEEMHGIRDAGRSYSAGMQYQAAR